MRFGMYDLLFTILELAARVLAEMKLGTRWEELSFVCCDWVFRFTELDKIGVVWLESNSRMVQLRKPGSLKCV